MVVGGLLGAVAGEGEEDVVERRLVDGHLVQIDTLLNDTTIEQVKQDEIHVFHIELDRHDVILADGMPSETFLDVGNRAVFEDGPVVPLDPDGSFCVYLSHATHLVVDLQGSFSPTGDLRFVPVTPVRQHDSRVLNAT